MKKELLREINILLDNTDYLIVKDNRMEKWILFKKLIRERVFKLIDNKEL